MGKMGWCMGKGKREYTGGWDEDGGSGPSPW